MLSRPLRKPARRRGICSRNLIEQQNKGQCALRRLSPIIEFSEAGTFMKRAELLPQASVEGVRFLNQCGCASDENQKVTTSRGVVGSFDIFVIEASLMFSRRIAAGPRSKPAQGTFVRAESFQTGVVRQITEIHPVQAIMEISMPSVSHFIVWIVIGVLGGSLAGFVITWERGGFGFFRNLVLGIAGALVGGLLFRVFRLFQARQCVILAA